MSTASDFPLPCFISKGQWSPQNLQKLLRFKWFKTTSLASNSMELETQSPNQPPTIVYCLSCRRLQEVPQHRTPKKREHMQTIENGWSQRAPTNLLKINAWPSIQLFSVGHLAAHGTPAFAFHVQIFFWLSTIPHLWKRACTLKKHAHEKCKPCASFILPPSLPPSLARSPSPSPSPSLLSLCLSLSLSVSLCLSLSLSVSLCLSLSLSIAI